MSKYTTSYTNYSDTFETLPYVHKTNLR